MYSINFLLLIMLRIKKNEQTKNSQPDSTCRICFEIDQTTNLISPCLCKGSSKYVHHDCLLTWIRSTNKTSSKLSCDICRYKYKWSNQSYKLFIMCMIYEFFKFLLILIVACSLLGSLRTFNQQKFLKNFNNLVDLVSTLYYGFSLIIYFFGILAWLLVLVFLEPNLNVNLDLIHYFFMPYYVLIPGFVLFLSIIYIHFQESRKRYAFILSTKERILNIN
jgi:hypothetical protein